jgi:hypothetical protein
MITCFTSFPPYFFRLDNGVFKQSWVIVTKYILVSVHSEYEMYQTNFVYTDLYIILLKQILANVINFTGILHSATKLCIIFPWIIRFLEVYQEFIHWPVITPFLVQGLMRAEYSISGWSTVIMPKSTLMIWCIHEVVLLKFCPMSTKVTLLDNYNSSFSLFFFFFTCVSYNNNLQFFYCCSNLPYFKPKE